MTANLQCPACGHPLTVRVTLTPRATDRDGRRVVTVRAAGADHHCTGEWP